MKLPVEVYREAILVWFESGDFGCFCSSGNTIWNRKMKHLHLKKAFFAAKI